MSTAFVPAHDPTDVALVDSVQRGDRPLRELALHASNSCDIRLRELDQVMGVSSWPSAPALGHHVSGVFSRLSDKQVRRPDAGRVVAGVAHKSPWPDFESDQPGGVDVRASRLSVNPKGAVPACAECCPPPDPAIAGLVDVVPEALFVGHSARWASLARAPCALVVEAAEALGVGLHRAVFGGAIHSWQL